MDTRAVGMRIQGVGIGAPEVSSEGKLAGRPQP